MGIRIFASTGAVTDPRREVSYLVDPATWTPLEDVVLDSKGAVVSRQMILSLSTRATMPPNPYTT